MIYCSRLWWIRSDLMICLFPMFDYHCRSQKCFVKTYSYWQGIVWVYGLPRSEVMVHDLPDSPILRIWSFALQVHQPSIPCSLILWLPRFNDYLFVLSLLLLLAVGCCCRWLLLVVVGCCWLLLLLLLLLVVVVVLLSCCCCCAVVVVLLLLLFVVRCCSLNISLCIKRTKPSTNEQQMSRTKSQWQPAKQSKYTRTTKPTNYNNNNTTSETTLCVCLVSVIYPLKQHRTRQASQQQ